MATMVHHEVCGNCHQPFCTCARPCDGCGGRGKVIYMRQSPGPEIPCRHCSGSGSVPQSKPHVPRQGDVEKAARALVEAVRAQGACPGNLTPLVADLSKACGLGSLWTGEDP